MLSVFYINSFTYLCVRNFIRLMSGHLAQFKDIKVKCNHFIRLTKALICKNMQYIC